MTTLLSRKEYEELIISIPQEHCRLCETDKQIILGSSEHWLWVACLSPYWPYHTLFIPKRHCEDLSELSEAEFKDFKEFYEKVKAHFHALELKHYDGKKMDQFVLMIRVREENMENGSTYPKPKHLHIHFVPDREGVERFKIDENALRIDMTTIALRD